MIPRPLRFCTLSGTVESMHGEPLENAFVRVRILEGIEAIVGAVAVSSSPQCAYTEDDGTFEFTLPRGALARIEIPESGVDASFTVPDLASATLANLTLAEYDG